MYTIVGIRDYQPIAITVASDPFEACTGITRGYIIHDGAVMAIIGDDGGIFER